MLHIDIPTLEEFKALAQIKGETCVSLYLPVSPLVGNIQANRTEFKDLAKEALSQLKEAGVDKHQTRSESSSARSRTRSMSSGTIRHGWSRAFISRTPKRSSNRGRVWSVAATPAIKPAAPFPASASVVPASMAHDAN